MQGWAHNNWDFIRKMDQGLEAYPPQDANRVYYLYNNASYTPPLYQNAYQPTFPNQYPAQMHLPEVYTFPHGKNNNSQAQENNPA